MRLVKKIGAFFIAVAVIMVSAFSFVGCDKTKNDGGNLSFETVATILTDFNEKLKPFLATLEFKYNNSEDEAAVKLMSTSISSLTKGMSESMKAFQSVFNQYVQLGDESTEIVSTAEMVSIKTDRSEYIAKLNKNATDLSIYTKDGSNECLYEIKVKASGGYLLQIVTKNTTGDSYSIYQIDFSGTKGKLCIDETASV